MSSYKSGTSMLRASRSKSSAQRSGVVNTIGRNITATTKTSTHTNLVATTRPAPYCVHESLPRTLQRNPTFRNSVQSPLQNTTRFGNLVAALTQTLAINSRPSLPQLHDLLRAYTSNPEHWSKYAHANPSKQYTRNLVAEVPGLFNLLLLVWTPGKASPIHDHADAHCLMKVLSGSLRETRYAIPQYPGLEGELTKTSELDFRLDRVSYMSDKLGLHRIENPSIEEYAVSLHLYFPPNAATRGCRIFDQENGGARHVMQGAYDSVKGVAGS